MEKNRRRKNRPSVFPSVFEAFPIDVWMKRVLEQVYFEGEEKTKNELAAFAKDKYGEYGGYAQQYLFAYAREEL